MRSKRHIITAAVAVVCAMGAPAPASAGGIDPTRWCMQDAANDYLYSPYSIARAKQFVVRTNTCSRYFAMHMLDDEKRAGWEKCLDSGLQRSIQSLAWDPLVAALYNCTAHWLEFSVQVDPYP